MATMATNFSDFVGVTEASRLLGMTSGRVRQLVGNHEQHAIKARKINDRAWMISLSELRKYAKKNGIELREDKPHKNG